MKSGVFSVAVAKTPERAANSWRSRSKQDMLARGLILGAGALCFVLLAWVHLGLGALVMPPANTVMQQSASAGSLHVTLALDSGQLTAAGPNTVSMKILDHAGRPVVGAIVIVHPMMRTMAMDAPSVGATQAPDGAYLAHPKFAMAGAWRLIVTITQRGHAPPQSTSFNVTARWT